MGKLEKYIIAIAVSSLILFLVWYFSSIVIYIIISFVLSIIGLPLMHLIEKIKIGNKTTPRWLSATVVLVVFIALFSIAVNVFVPLLYEKISYYTSEHMQDFTNAVSTPIDKINNMLRTHFGNEFNIGSEQLIMELASKSKEVVGATLKNIGSIIDFATSLFVATFSIFFITYFFLKEDMLFRSSLKMLFPAKYDKKVDTALTSSISLLSKYFLALVAESTIKLIIITGGLTIFGVDFQTSLIIGLISAVLNVIPYIGPLIGAIVGIGIAIVTYQGDIGSLLIFSTSLFAVFQIIDNIILQPYIYSTSVKAHPLEIFLIILLAGSFAGVWGMLMAIPVYTILRVFAREFFYNLRVVQELTKSIDE